MIINSEQTVAQILRSRRVLLSGLPNKINDLLRIHTHIVIPIKLITVVTVAHITGSVASHFWIGPTAITSRIEINAVTKMTTLNVLTNSFILPPYSPARLASVSCNDASFITRP